MAGVGWGVMGYVIAVFIIFLVIIGMVVVGHQTTTGYLEKIQFQRGRKQKLTQALRDAKQGLADLRETQMFITRQLEGVADYSLGAAGGDLITGTGKPAARRAAMAHHTVVDVLLAEKLLSSEDLMKAENYKLQSKSPYAIDEILSLLGYVSPDVIQRIKRRYPNLS
ncbi:hypothetical protein DSM19430T_17790 [Desulfovibrio psychrotolerans]|uniref:Uncharacterized protein n=2 Tax=Desulfovibrio psychrotolerans TaxID=415242 RepID=A0A7J0BVB0_9BACT|nr:hypothetical protein DSM19430T_17790 [Desulfovibrio psychrotolerans]